MHREESGGSRSVGPTAERLDAVEIKATLMTDEANAAADALGLVADGVDQWVYFCEHLAGDQQWASSLPLLDNGVVLRLRHASGRKDESTVKLRPCRRSSLGPRWTALHTSGDHDFRIEADWSGGTRMLAASLVARRHDGCLEEVLTGRCPPQCMFTDLQREFLADCAAVPATVDSLTVLGPILVRRCDRVRWRGYDIAAQWWTLPGLPRLLELSLRVEPRGAEIIELGFDASLRHHGIGVKRAPQRKTHLFLESLARRWKQE
jgi:hypothetical protein